MVNALLPQMVVVVYLVVADAVVVVGKVWDLHQPWRANSLQARMLPRLSGQRTKSSALCHFSFFSAFYSVAGNLKELSWECTNNICSSHAQVQIPELLTACLLSQARCHGRIDQTTCTDASHFISGNADW
jgi:hypothetical protein